MWIINDSISVQHTTTQLCDINSLESISYALRLPHFNFKFTVLQFTDFVNVHHRLTADAYSVISGVATTAGI